MDLALVIGIYVVGAVTGAVIAAAMLVDRTTSPAYEPTEDGRHPL